VRRACFPQWTLERNEETIRRNLTIKSQFRGMLLGIQPRVLELIMPRSLQYSVRIMRLPDKRLAVLAAICVACFFSVLPSASAQSQTTHYRSQSTAHYTTHYGSPSRAHSVNQKPRSVPSSVAPEVLGRPTGGAPVSPTKQLDQLERATVLKPLSAKSAAAPASTKSTLVPEKHSAPINFTHKELPQSPHSGPAKIH
jgi:hypothetical protein